MAESVEPAAEARCARCGAAFVCGLRAGAPECWCASRPPLTPVTGADCLCPGCLDEALRQQAHS